MTDTLLQLVVSDIRAEARDIVSIELRAVTGGTLPPFTAGAHLELLLPNGLVRQYSLCNDPAESDRYVIGVGRSRPSRGGSEFLHGAIRRGDVLRSRPPRNHFPMVEDAPAHFFVAGGIGITPVLAMIRTCLANGTPWHLLYIARSRSRAAFLEDLADHAASVTLHFDDEAGGLCDVSALVGAAPADAPVYCCGPAPLMAAVEAAVADRPPELVRFEYFAPRAQEDLAPAGGFTLRLSKRGISIPVAAEQTILEALEAHGIEISWACREGVCGSCELGIVSGVADHRDSFLSRQERESNKTIVTCCSRALTPELEIDL
ncbi:MAG: oxidoreductase [Novosphingobium sp.]|nr:oxidoreductase [Novosphingobium sp.]